MAVRTVFFVSKNLNNSKFFIKRKIYKTITRVPAARRIEPTSDFKVNCSCKNTKARIKVKTVLILSIGTTFDASPICKAL